MNELDYKIIKAVGGQEIKVDKDWYEMLSLVSWHINSGYARNSTGNGHRGERQFNFMHRLIMDVPRGLWSDHINGDKLDNRASNLRVCTPQENSFNRKAHGEKNKYKGITKVGNVWRALICKDYKRLHIGYYKCEIKAAQAYNDAAKRLHGKFAYLNKIIDAR